ncbi:MAG: DNA cytosine methyltransferase [Bacteriovoracaceae bacterium]|nr:DNA cytosine methyltransferase [Bacteriovoracaceae bacterium]
MEVINLHRLKSGIITGMKGGGYVTKKMLTSFIEDNQKLKIIDNLTGKDITNEILDPLLEKIQFKNGNLEVLNLWRHSSGIITKVKNGKAITQVIFESLVEKNQKLRIVDKVTNEDITNEILDKILEKIRIKKENLELENNKKINLPELPEEFVQEKIKNVNSENLCDNSNGEFNFVDLFCGAGGLSIGLEQAGMSCILGTDINTYAMQSFREYHKNAETFCGPISSLTDKDLKEKIGNKRVDLVCGGPPCQGFSTIGEGNKDDRRNSLFEEFVRVVRVLGPTYMLFENVSGLLAAKNEKTLNAILSSFKALGYHLKIKVLESQHFGVPQKRKRIIILGCKENYAFDFPKPIFDCVENGKYVRPVNLGEVIDDIATENGEIFNHQVDKATPERISVERISCIPEGRGIRYKKDEDEFFPDKLKLGFDWSKMKEGRLRELRFFRLSRMQPTPTINTGCTQYYHPNENRHFTVRELARIQTFPNNFKLYGNIVSQRKLVGNAVPVLMGKAIGRSLLESFNLKQQDNEVYTIDIEKLKGKGFCYREDYTDKF